MQICNLCLTISLITNTKLNKTNTNRITGEDYFIVWPLPCEHTHKAHFFKRIYSTAQHKSSIALINMKHDLHIATLLEFS